MSKPKLLIVGHGRHGKDTVAEILRDHYGFTFMSSSLFCAEFVKDAMQDIGVDYPTVEDCYEDRANHRAFWFDTISNYNTPDMTRTAEGMFKRKNDLYVGMRKREEYKACVAARLFDRVVWVDRSEHLPPEGKESMELQESDSDVTIDNNGTLEQLLVNVGAFIKGIHK
jgi:hypothetical protein